MPLYMTQFAYTPEAWAALVDNPEDRSAAVRELTESMEVMRRARETSFRAPGQ